MTVHNLGKIFQPSSIAVIGLGDKRQCVSSTVLGNLLAAGFEGRVYPVDPHHQEVQGLPSYASVADLPEPADLAVVCVPAGVTPQIVRQCGDAGVAGIVIISAGFREIGPRGVEIEQQVQEASAAFGDMRILGPNCLGIVVPHRKLNASLAPVTPKPGGVAFVSQSTTLCTSALDWAIQEDIGFSHFVSIGNMLQVGVGDLIDYLAEDPYTDSIILYVESITNARQFMSAARATTKEKPIVVYKGGRFSESAEAAVTHSGAMSGVDAVYEAAFERAGIVRVFEIDDMFDCAQLLARTRRTAGPRLAIVTNAGGPGVVAIDSLIDRKGVLAQLADETVSQLDRCLPLYWSRSNPVDILSDATPDRFRHTIEIVLKDPGVDALLVILTPQAASDPTHTARVVAEVAGRTHKPVLAAWMGGTAVRDGITILNQSGVPTYNTPKNAVHAFMHLISYARNRETLLETPQDVPMSFSQDRQRQQQLFNSIATSECELLSEELSKQLLEGYGIRTTLPQRAASPSEAVRLAREIGYPVVLKIVSPQISHKNEVGGVVLNVAYDEDVRAAYRRIVASASQALPGATIEGVNVQPMAAAPDAFEMILGSRKDPVFGAVILIGAGGVAAELLGDFALGLPPLNERLARRMLESLRSWPIIAGHHCRPPADIAGLIQTLIRFSYVVADCPQIGEMDVNPLLVSPRDVIALDARVRVDRNYQPNTRRYAHLAIRPYPEELVHQSTLTDGTPVVLRPIRPEDEPLWHDMLAACSPHTIRLRFRSMFKEMTHEMAARFCFMDYDRELAIVAEVTDGDQRKLIGVVHLVCNADHTSAEYAALVPDAWQRRGVGKLITTTSLQIAADWGLSEVIGYTERDNRGMLRTFEHAGFVLDYESDADVVIARKSLLAGRPKQAG